MTLECTNVEFEHIEITNLIDIECYRSLDKIAIEFKEIDTTNKGDLKKWFAKYGYLSVNEMAQIAGVSELVVFWWKRFVDYKPPKWVNKKKNKQGGSYKCKPAIDEDLLPPLTPTSAWYVDMHQSGYSVAQLSRACKISRIAVTKIIKLSGAKVRSRIESVRSRHPCNNLSWITHYYLHKKLSCKKCAELAGVQNFTFTTWLNRLGIRVRPTSEQIPMNHGSCLGKQT